MAPWPPVRSGVADYAAEQATALAALADVERYAPSGASRAAAAGHDVLLVHVGNDPVHLPSVELLADGERRVPAVVLLHDFALHHLFAAAFLDRGRERDYARELARCHGENGRALGERAVAGERYPVWDLEPWAFPMSRGVVSDATAVVVHSRLVRGAVLREVPGVRVVEIPHHVVPAPRTDRGEARERLGLPAGRCVACSLGAVVPAKRLAKVLEALAAIPAGERPFLFVGGAVPDDDLLRSDVGRLGLSGDVLFSGYLEDDDFWLAASAADLAVNLRFPTMGETSGAVCRLAGHGLPVVVSDVGWFAELPDSFAVRVPVGSAEVDALASVLARLASDPKERARLSSHAAAGGEERRPERVAPSLLRILSEAASGASRAAALSSRLALELAALGVGTGVPGGSADRGPDARLLLGVAGAAAGVLAQASDSLRWSGK